MIVSTCAATALRRPIASTSAVAATASSSRRTATRVQQHQQHQQHHQLQALQTLPQRRGLATPVSSVSSVGSGSGATQHKVLVVGGGAASQSISHQLARTGYFSEQGDIAVIDPRSEHDYQPGWTLVGAGLKTKEELRRPMSDLVGDGDGLQLYSDAVETFEPEKNLVKTRDGKTISYEHLVVVPGLGHYPERIEGLKEAIADPSAKVASIYDYNSCDTVWDYIQEHKSGPAIFTQPPQPHKCAGAPQKIMWLAWDHWRQNGVRGDIPITFATALPAMFSVPKYSKVLDELRKERDVEGLFGHDLVSVEGSSATFKTTSGEKVTKKFDFLHATPHQGPLPFIKNSPLADPTSGFVSVDQGTMRHTKYSNVYSAGDSSTLPTSKTAAAITAQAPILVANLLRNAMGIKDGEAPTYDGYTSCPLLTEYGKVLLAEFVYGAQPKETFAQLFGIDQAKPNRAFYHLKKDFFPWVYYNSMVKGTWAGPKGFSTGLKGVAPAARSMSTSTRPRSAAGPSNRRGFATSARTHRDQPSRRHADPLDKDPSAVRHALSSGETFIVRPSASAGLSRNQPTVLDQAGTVQSSPTSRPASKISAQEVIHLPPVISPSRSSLQKGLRKKTVTASMALEAQQLRSSDPFRYTPSVLARKFGCSEWVMRTVTAKCVSKEYLRQREAEVEKATSVRSWQKQLASEARKARRALW